MSYSDPWAWEDYVEAMYGEMPRFRKGRGVRNMDIGKVTEVIEMPDPVPAEAPIKEVTPEPEKVEVGGE